MSKVLEFIKSNRKWIALAGFSGLFISAVHSNAEMKLNILSKNLRTVSEDNEMLRLQLKKFEGNYKWINHKNVELKKEVEDYILRLDRQNKRNNKKIDKIAHNMLRFGKVYIDSSKKREERMSKIELYIKQHKRFSKQSTQFANTFDQSEIEAT